MIGILILRIFVVTVFYYSHVGIALKMEPCLTRESQLFAGSEPPLGFYHHLNEICN